MAINPVLQAPVYANAYQPSKLNNGRVENYLTFNDPSLLGTVHEGVDSQPVAGLCHHLTRSTPPSVASFWALERVRSRSLSLSSDQQSITALTPVFFSGNSETPPSSQGSQVMHTASPDDSSVEEDLQTPDEDVDKLSDEVMQRVVHAARTCLRDDCVQFLEANLARWGREGIWRDSQPSNLATSMSSYNKLQRAYSFVCKLDTRMNDDTIRSRMAMVALHLEYENTFFTKKGNVAGRRKTRKLATSVGRGHTSSIIDGILESTHADWSICGSRERTVLREKFHQWKRFGKRWCIVAGIMGPGIMLLGSARFAGVMYARNVLASYDNEADIYTVETPQLPWRCLSQ